MSCICFWNGLLLCGALSLEQVMDYLHFEYIITLTNLEEVPYWSIWNASGSRDSFQASYEHKGIPFVRLGPQTYYVHTNAKCHKFLWKFIKTLVRNEYVPRYNKGLESIFHLNKLG